LGDIVLFFPSFSELVFFGVGFTAMEVDSEVIDVHGFCSSMKGIILAGGKGSRLYPLTAVISKQIHAIYDKPMIYYPLSTLIELGVREVCVVGDEWSIALYRLLFKDLNIGVRFEFVVQEEPEGIAQALVLAEEFVGGDSVALILGDNFFHARLSLGVGLARFNDEVDRSGGVGCAMVFAVRVRNPSAYGVVGFDEDSVATSIEEKPLNPKSNHVVAGLYLYTNWAIEVAKSLSKSDRGEYEITDVNLAFLYSGRLFIQRLEANEVWLDAGSYGDLHEASAYVKAIQERTGLLVGSPEEMAYRKGLIDRGALAELVHAMPDCVYRQSLNKMLVDEIA
jgi:glucose-1-phosphate thymidylyltransferase